MIKKPLDQIEFPDIELLVRDKWPEGKTIDYKRETYGNKDADKKELLKDVSSFANTMGGDIVIGVDESGGLPTDIPGAIISDVDKEKLRLEGIIRQGLEPRIEFGIKHVDTPSGSTVIIIRVQESLVFPHRVVFHGKFGEFWGRSSAGKFSLDTDELRKAFTMSETINQQIRQFRVERVSQIVDGATPVPILGGGRFILHLIPTSAFRTRQHVNVVELLNQNTLFSPIGSSGWDHRLNLDGLVTYGGGNQDRGSRAYTLLFRNSIVESVLAEIIQGNEKSNALIIDYYEFQLIFQYRAFERYLDAFKKLDVKPPIWCFVTLTGVKNAYIPTKGMFADERREIDRDLLFLPEIIIDDLDVDPLKILRPLFDLVWNASGYVGSFNFDKGGKWVGR